MEICEDIIFTLCGFDKEEFNTVRNSKQKNIENNKQYVVLDIIASSFGPYSCWYFNKNSDTLRTGDPSRW